MRSIVFLEHLYNKLLLPRSPSASFAALKHFVRQPNLQPAQAYRGGANVIRPSPFECLCTPLAAGVEIQQYKNLLSIYVNMNFSSRAMYINIFCKYAKFNKSKRCIRILTLSHVQEIHNLHFVAFDLCSYLPLRGVASSTDLNILQSGIHIQIMYVHIFQTRILVYTYCTILYLIVYISFIFHYIGIYQ